MTGNRIGSQRTGGLKIDNLNPSNITTIYINQPSPYSIQFNWIHLIRDNVNWVLVYIDNYWLPVLAEHLSLRSWTHLGYLHRFTRGNGAIGGEALGVVVGVWGAWLLVGERCGHRLLEEGVCKVLIPPGGCTVPACRDIGNGTDNLCGVCPRISPKDYQLASGSGMVQ